MIGGYEIEVPADAICIGVVGPESDWSPHPHDDGSWDVGRVWAVYRLHDTILVLQDEVCGHEGYAPRRRLWAFGPTWREMEAGIERAAERRRLRAEHPPFSHPTFRLGQFWAAGRAFRAVFGGDEPPRPSQADGYRGLGVWMRLAEDWDTHPAAEDPAWG